MVLYATSDAKDTDFTAKLVDVSPGRKSLQPLRRHHPRALSRRVQASDRIEPGKVYKYEIDMWTTSNLFKSGHRIGVEISSSNFPQFDRNTNCAGEGGPQCRKVAHQVILHDAANPSHLVLPPSDTSIIKKAKTKAPARKGRGFFCPSRGFDFILVKRKISKVSKPRAIIISGRPPRAKAASRSRLRSSCAAKAWARRSSARTRPKYIARWTSARTRFGRRSARACRTT